jgi:DNA-binding LacI/PurR family transcriptional regulator
MLRKHPEITAIFAVNDKMAIGALHYATRQQPRGAEGPSRLSASTICVTRAFMNPSLSEPSTSALQRKSALELASD